MRTLVLALALTSLAGAQARPVTTFDPAGKWTFSTVDEKGAAISGTMEITGKPGTYTGTIAGGGDQPLQITEVFTSSTGAVLLANLPDGIAFIKMSKEPDGKIKCNWSPVRDMTPATLTRSAGQ